MSGLADGADLLSMAVEEGDADTVASVAKDVAAYDKRVEELEFRRMFSGRAGRSQRLPGHPGRVGGTEAQDWAGDAAAHVPALGRTARLQDRTDGGLPGEVAGIKSATIRFEGEYAFGWLRTETGVHRLVRKSPFDSGNRRHTSFSSVFVSPRSTIPSRWRSTRLTCESMSTVPPVLAVSTSTGPSQRCVSPTCRRAP